MGTRLVPAATFSHHMRLSPLFVMLSVAVLAGCAADPKDPAAGGSGGNMPGTTPGKQRTPFGSRAMTYPAGTILPSGLTAALDAAVTSAYDRWKSAYLSAGCGGQVVKTGGGTGADDALTVSEGHGYGMMITAIMDGHDARAQELFDGLYRVFRTVPSTINRELMAWAIGSNCRPVGAANSATDGDLDIAFALLLANRQWGSDGPINYLGEARKVIAAIDASEMNSTTRLPLMGDWAKGGGTLFWATRPSDFMLDHFRAFGAVSGSGGWTTTVDRIYAVTASLQSRFSTTTGLLPDFVINTQSMPTPPNGRLLESANDDDYGWNSCRVPWRIGTDWVVSGDARAKQALDRINGWIKTASGGDPGAVVDGYRLDGSHLGQGDSAAFIAPFGVAAMVDPGSQPWLDAVWGWLTSQGSQGYYADSIKLLSMIVMSGNWWAP